MRIYLGSDDVSSEFHKKKFHQYWVDNGVFYRQEIERGRHGVRSLGDFVKISASEVPYVTDRATLHVERSFFRDLETKMDSLVSYVMRNYLREAQNGDTVCKFCYCYQKSSTYESHYDDCPRLAWATEHNDFPCDRVEERMGKTYPNWGIQVDICKSHSSTLTSDGLFMNEFIFGKA